MRRRSGSDTALKSADLHVHSDRSDGTDPPARVVERAARAGLAAVALTDHDTTEGLDEAREAGARLGVEVIAGIELSTDYAGREVHLLAYFIHPEDPALSAKLSDMAGERLRRVDRIVGRLNALGIPLTFGAVRALACGRSMGRPHVAEALVRGGFVSSYESAWKEYLHAGARAYVERARLDFTEALALVRNAGGTASVAHPTLNLDLALLETVAASGVQALETVHPSLSEAEAAALRDLCARRGLVESGGSDCHGTRRGEPTMGSFRVPFETVEALRGRARRCD